MQHNSINDFIGLIADLMAIFGIGGFFSWSFVKKSVEERDLADTGINIFAYAIKFFICVLILVTLLVPIFYSHLTVVLIASGHFGSGDGGLWNPAKPVAYVLSYIITSLWAIPFSVLAVSSVFSWSLTPFKKLFQVIRGKNA